MDNEIKGKVEELNERDAKDMLVDLIENTYTMVTWPESQDYMDKEWFSEEAIATAESGGYLIPTHRKL